MSQALPKGGGAVAGALPELLRDALSRPSAGAGLRIVFPAPTCRVEALLRVRPDEDAIVWAPPTGPAFAGVGAYARLELRGRDELAALEAEGRRRLGEVETRGIGSVEPLPPRLYGGMAFDPRTAEGGPWAGFGAGAFVLPRWTLQVEAHGATLALCVSEAERAGRAEALIEEALGLCAQLDRDSVAAPQGIWPAPVEELDPSRWAEMIAEIKGMIAAGEAAKVVAARCGHARLPAPIDEARVIERLSAEYEDCYRFGRRAGGATFLGATPERLVALDGDEVRVTCLAGSIAASSGPVLSPDADPARQLLASEKDLGEHQQVVEMVRGALAELVSERDPPEGPEVRSLRHLLHLHTPYTGRLRRPAHVLELVARLHPTPAVGGAPRAPALDWISRQEPTPRGWYAGPFGWFDGEGGGELSVSIRSALLRGEEAWIFTGAGIVADSDPAAEYAETALKQRPMRRALGISG